jgi:hypothetical protein
MLHAAEASLLLVGPMPRALVFTDQPGHWPIWLDLLGRLLQESRLLQAGLLLL